MADYKRNEAREWAWENLVGCSGVTIPSYSADLKHLNERGIRHDIQKIASLGFKSTLLCTEVAITPEENAQLTAWAKDTSGDELDLFFHAGFGTLGDNIEAVKLAEKAGADIALLSYPSNFWPTSEQDIYDYTKEFCDATDLAVMLFAIPLWGFERVHPQGMSPELIRRLIDECPNVVSLKAEQGFPHIGGLVESYHRFRDDVIISCPIESDIIPLMKFMDLQFSGTSYTQWMGDHFPTTFNLAREGKWEEAMALYWQAQPARAAVGAATGAYMAGSNYINRAHWKYMDWLAGFNGGPLRAPGARIPDRMMKTLRQGLVASKLECTSDDDSQFLIGRFPC
ncbi:dihydrodipicolinate synthase family protein [Pseudomonas sp.]|uniref:dihydrodipicolinate synthase family protein n=1 Tax=Pseudomonas sp. TaxID=306 RepID=UPI001A108593|nr:dihydrodipicolinate synthase family protein [Pseudomonas sp.]MBF0674753.1 dihydrodipicolinate synthase family protein [Pseudomonas sp.]